MPASEPDRPRPAALPARVRTVLSALAWVLGVYALACAGLYLWQRQMMYFPQPRALTPPATLSLRHAGEPDVVVQVSAAPADGPEALIYLGGNAEDVSRNLPDFTRAMPGRALYLMHYRGFADSTGRPAEAALVRDALALFDWAHSRHARITVVGRSLGSGIAVQVAAQRPVHRLVLVTPYDSVLNVAREAYALFPVRWLLKDTYESVRYAPLVQAPVTVIAARQDRLIRPVRTQALIPHFPKGRVTEVWVEHAGHDTVQLDPRYLELLAGR